ncbi:MAG TPA: DUF58 domain-containing protein, partial [Symbiobacteriaceae bacterium]|nr:DUF58 domain-containing protein [Symbiobacteriaceae bacterium]
MRTFLWLYLIGALLIPGRPLYTILYFAGGVYLLTRVSLKYAVRRLEVERELSDARIFLGESVTVTLKLKNPTGMPVPWLQFIESRPQQMASEPFCRVVTLGPNQTLTERYSLLGSKRGRYEAGGIMLQAGDPFGMASHEERRAETAQFTVYPRVSPLTDLGLPARLPMGDLATRRRLFEDPAWLTGTREYVAGDSLRRIHWNATARTGELMVKQFRHAMLLPSCLFLNLNRADYGGRSFWLESELAISAAASLGNYLVEQKQQMGLVVAGVDPDVDADARLVRLPLRQGRGAMVEMLELLARVQAAAEPIPFAQAVVEEAQRLPWGTLLCIVTPTETPELAAACARLARSGQQVLLFVTDGEGGRRSGYQVHGLADVRGEVVVG